MVRTLGEAEPLGDERSLVGLLHAPAQAAAATAYDAATRKGLPSVLVRVETHCADAMDRMVAAG